MHHSVMRPNVQRGLVALVQVLCLATWFSASAVVPTLQTEWQISLISSVWLTASTQLGFVIGAVGSAILNLADRLPTHVLLSISGIGAACCTLLFAGLSQGLASAVPLRLATGVFLAGVYPVGMKIMASWAGPGSRARSLGLLIGALTLGSALPHVIGTVSVNWRLLLTLTAATTVLGALICVLLIRSGPNFSSKRFVPQPAYVLEMFRDRRQRLVNFGYLGHMWELYALWAWLPLFATMATRSDSLDPGMLSLATFIAVGVAGAAGCLIGGWCADRYGRRPIATGALAASGVCCLLSPLAYHASAVLLLVFAMVWGATVIADSGIFSTMLSELVEGPYAGTALTAQTAAGFLLTVVSIQLIPIAAAAVTWQYALTLLALGPVLGVAAMVRYPATGRDHGQLSASPAPGR